MPAPVAEDRGGFIGGSDIAAILGISRWRTPLSVWAEKTGQVPPDDSDNLPKKLGRRLEEVVAELFMEKTGLKVQRANERRVHPKYPHFRAQIDRLIVGQDELLECKTASPWMAKEWAEEEMPQEYIAQVMWQLACSGRKRGHLAVLIGNQDFKTRVIERDPVLIAEMIKRANAFWEEFVVPKVMPSQISDRDAETLYALFPNAEPDSQVDLGDKGAMLVENRNALVQDKIDVEKRIDLVENELKAMLQDKETGMAGKWKVVWKNQTRKEYMVKASTFRALRIREIKDAESK